MFKLYRHIQVSKVVRVWQEMGNAAGKGLTVHGEIQIDGKGTRHKAS